MSRTGRHLFIFGLGFSGATYARRALEDFETVGGTVRSAVRAEQLRAEGIAAQILDGSLGEAGVAPTLGRATHLVQSIAPGAAGDPVLRSFRAAILQAPSLSWIGYLSTVGVYGDHGGAWVDEATACRPLSQRSIERLAVEAAWQDLAEEKGVPLAVLRLAGIYGPGRNALANLADGSARRLVKPGQVFNRIHVDDIAAALAAAAERRASGIFNVTDNEPGPPQDVVAYAASLAGHAPLPDIPFETAELSPMARSFYAENKRVSNRRLREELGVDLAFPTYREGLRRLFEAQDGRGSAAQPKQDLR